MTRSPVWQLVYLSDALIPTDAMLLDIVRTAEVENARHGLSGLLCYSKSRFVQLIEGERAAVVQLLRNLRHDLRHNVTWAAFRKVPGRCILPSLPMGYAGEGQLAGTPAADILAAPAAAISHGAMPGLAEAMVAAAARLYPSQVRVAEIA